MRDTPGVQASNYSIRLVRMLTFAITYLRFIDIDFYCAITHEGASGVILLDLHLPDAPGLQVLCELGARQRKYHRAASDGPGSCCRRVPFRRRRYSDRETTGMGSSR